MNYVSHSIIAVSMEALLGATKWMLVSTMSTMGSAREAETNPLRRVKRKGARAGFKLGSTQ